MSKVLVVLVHPDLSQSRVNARLAEAAGKNAEVTVHDLYAAYPDFKIDVAKEQELLLAHDRIIFQFPFFWYSSPALLKQWFDAVLTYGWAYGSNGNKLHGKEFGLAFTTGGAAEAYQAGGSNQYSFSELIKPFQATSNLIGMRFLTPFIVSGVRNLTDEELNAAAAAYSAYLLKQPAFT